MNLGKSDLAHIKWSLLAFTLSVAVGGSAIWLSATYESAARKARDAAQKQVREAGNMLGATQSDLENMSTYALEYAALIDRRIVGGEQRLDWMEELEKLRRQHHVIDFKYTIAPQQPYIPTPALNTGDLEINLSGLSLQIDLLHEMQLIEFFKALRSDLKGWFIVDHCTLERAASANTAETSSAPNIGAQLKADCAGGWITLNNRNAQ
ncbi:MAG: hypothetical protein WC825_10870 [Gallionellaceae bacterium]|jgi:hypothetical protein